MGISKLNKCFQQLLRNNSLTGQLSEPCLSERTNSQLIITVIRMLQSFTWEVSLLVLDGDSGMVLSHPLCFSSFGYVIHFFKKNKFIYLFLAVLGLRCCAWTSGAVSRGCSLLWCAGFSLRWLLLLWSMGSRHVGSVVVARGL